MKSINTHLIALLVLLLIVTTDLPSLCARTFAYTQEPSSRRISLKESTATKLTEPPVRISLGYSLFVADFIGGAVSVKPDRSFSNGDRVRIMIESSADAYLYVFNQEDDGELRMIFPDPSIRRGIATIAAGVPLNLPGIRDGEPPDSNWFNLSGSSTRERLIMVLSLTQIDGWPSKRELLDYPAGYALSRNEFDQITSETIRGVEETSGDDSSTASRNAEDSAIERGAKVSHKEPVTSKVVVTAPRGATKVIVQIELRRAPGVRGR